MPASIGVNLRVTGHCRQGGRKYMEDFFSVAYQQTEDEKDLEYAFFGIYDGHGGAEAAAFAKEHLMETIIKHKNFWSDNDQDVLHAIKDGYIATHYAMWREQEKWPKTASGLPSTAGTTASVAFIRRGKMYIGHVGDSGIILGYQEPGSSEWKAKPLTKDHKPENPEEIKRIEGCGGKVVAKSGVPRVVWNRPKIGHQGPVRRSTPIDEIPFLAVARSLGDLWSYNSQINQFIVSPDPDCSVIQIDTNIHRCLIFGTDGLYNMLSSQMAVHIVQQAERHNECAALSDATYKTWLNPSKLLVEKALERWQATRMRADNTTVVTLMLDPPGPPRAQVLKDRKKNLPESGLKIMTRYDGNTSSEQQMAETETDKISNSSINLTEVTEENQEQKSQESVPNTNIDNIAPCCSGNNVARLTPDKNADKALQQEIQPLLEHKKTTDISSTDVLLGRNYHPLKEHDFFPKTRESTSFDPRVLQQPSTSSESDSSKTVEDNTIQINEISSSNIEENASEGEFVEENSFNITTSLRSAKKLPKVPELDTKKPVKRKLLDAESLTRKSSRISLNQQQTKKPAPCTLAEEKLKKLAEEAEKTKHSDPIPNPSLLRKKRKLSLAQKILKSKRKISPVDIQKTKTNVILKQKKKRQLAMSKKKIQVVIETITKKSSNLIINNKKRLLKTNEGKQPEQKQLTVILRNDVSTVKHNQSRNAVKTEEIPKKNSENEENLRTRGNNKKEAESRRKTNVVSDQQSKKKSEVKSGLSEVTNDLRRSSNRLSSHKNVITKEECTNNCLKTSQAIKTEKAVLKSCSTNKTSLRIQEKMAKK